VSIYKKLIVKIRISNARSSTSNRIGSKYG